MSPSRAKQKMRHFVINSFSSTRLSKIVLARGLPFSELLPASVAYDSSRTTSSTPRSSSHMLPLLLNFLCWQCSVQTEFVFGSSTFAAVSYPLVHQLHHKHALPPAHRNPLADARVLDVRFLQCEHDDVSLVDSHTHGSQQSFDKGLRVALLAVPNGFRARVSVCTYRTTACCYQPHRLRRLSSWHPSFGSTSRSWQLPSRQ